MADIDFPASLPCMLSGTLGESATDTWVEDQGEVGAPRRRNRFTRVLRTFTLSMRLTTDQRAILLEFYDVTLDRGVNIFNWTHPWTGETIEVRLSGRPSIQHRANKRWGTELTLQEV